MRGRLQRRWQCNLGGFKVQDKGYASSSCLLFTWDWMERKRTSLFVLLDIQSPTLSKHFMDVRYNEMPCEVKLVNETR